MRNFLLNLVLCHDSDQVSGHSSIYAFLIEIFVLLWIVEILVF